MGHPMTDWQISAAVYAVTLLAVWYLTERFRDERR